MNINTAEYWNERYLHEHTPWDIGYPSPPILEYFKSIDAKKKRILIPGAGNAHEARWLWDSGYENVSVVDIAPKPLEVLAQSRPKLDSKHLINADFFDLEGQFDIIVEQTFFCALPPDLRSKYMSKMHELLAPGGYLFGLLFSFPLSNEGPPFGGSMEEYRNLFGLKFKIEKLETCYNSIAPRSGNELFIKFNRNDPNQ